MHPWQIVPMDITQPFITTDAGHKDMVVFKDLFTKYCITAPLFDRNAQRVARVFFEEAVVSQSAQNVAQ